MEADENGEITARNTYGTYLLSRTTKTEGYYYLYNAHGDVIMLLDAEEGGIAATYVYDAFGTILLQTGTVDNSITYAGYQYDYETGLYYVNARYYDSSTARFLTEDTYQGRQNDPLSLNRYTYCHNNPIRYYDPSGHFALFAAFLVGAVIGGVSEYVSQKVFQKKEKVDWKAVAYESLAGGIFTTISAVTGGLGTTAAVASTAARSAGKTVGKSAVKTAIKSVAKSAVKKSVKTAAKATVKTAAKTTAKSIAKTAIKTGVSEAAQGFATDVGRQVIVDGKSLNEVDYGQAVQSASIAGAFGIAGSMTSSVGKTAKASVKTSVAKYTDNVTTTVSNVTAKADNAVQAAVKKTKVSTVSVNGTGSKSGVVNSGSAAKTSQVTDAVSTNKVGNGVAEGATEAVSINPNKIRFSQSSVNGADEIIQSMKANGWKGDPIDVVRMPDGKLTTIDNTRVLSAKYAGIDVKANVYNYNDLLPYNKELIERLTTPKGIPSTWGDAVSLRIGKQNAGYRNLYPSGSNIIGWSGN